MSSSLDRKIEAAGRRAAAERAAKGLPPERFHKDDHQVDGTVKPSAHAAPAPAPAPAAPKKVWYCISGGWFNNLEPTLVYRTRDGLHPQDDGSNVIETLDKVVGTHVPDTVPGSVTSLPPQAPDPTLAPKRQLLSAAEMGEAETAAMLAQQDEHDETTIHAIKPAPEWRKRFDGDWRDANDESDPPQRWRTRDGQPPAEDMSNVTAMLQDREMSYAEARSLLAAQDEPVDHRVDAMQYMMAPRGHGKSWLTMELFREMEAAYAHHRQMLADVIRRGTARLIEPDEMPSGNFGQREPRQRAPTVRDPSAIVSTRRIIVNDEKAMAERSAQWCALVNKGMEDARQRGELPLTLFISPPRRITMTYDEWKALIGKEDPESPKAPDTAAPKD